jgi:hypothetical protein
MNPASLGAARVDSDPIGDSLVLPFQGQGERRSIGRDR